MPYRYAISRLNSSAQQVKHINVQRMGVPFFSILCKEIHSHNIHVTTILCENNILVPKENDFILGLLDLSRHSI